MNLTPCSSCLHRPGAPVDLTQLGKWPENSRADLKRTIAVLLDDILQRLVKLESKVDYIVVNGSATNTTNGTNGNLVPVTTNKRTSVSGSVR